MRLLVAALIAALLLVPSLVRARQALDLGRTATATSSFSKSADIPPDHVSVPPDPAVTVIDVDAVLHPADSFVVSHQESLPDQPDPLDTDALRGPPRHV
jgi:hypothetical protein